MGRQGRRRGERRLRGAGIGTVVACPAVQWPGTYASAGLANGSGSPCASTVSAGRRTGVCEISSR